MFAIIGSGDVMEAVLIQRISQSDWHYEVLFETSTEALQGTEISPTFQFDWFVIAKCFTEGQTGKRKDLAVITLATLGLLAVPTAQGMNLLEVLEVAEKEDPTYSRTQNEAAAIATLVPHARSTLFLPHLAVSASKKQIGQDIQLNSAFGAGGKTNYVATQYRINLKQPVYHHDRIINLFQAKKKFKKAQLSIIAAHQNLI